MRTGLGIILGVDMCRNGDSWDWSGGEEDSLGTKVVIERCQGYEQCDC